MVYAQKIDLFSHSISSVVLSVWLEFLSSNFKHGTWAHVKWQTIIIQKEIAHHKIIKNWGSLEHIMYPMHQLQSLQCLHASSVAPVPLTIFTYLSLCLVKFNDSYTSQ